MADSGIVGQRRRVEVIKHAFVLAVLSSAFFPLYMTLNISTKTNREFYNNRWYPDFTAEGFWGTTFTNYLAGWDQIYASIPNTIFLAVMQVIGTLVVAVLAAFVFARFRFPGKALLWSALLILMLVPGVANLIPLFVLLRGLGLLDTYTGLILVGVAGGQVFNIYVLRSYIEETSETLFEAAEVDGSGLLGQIWNIVIPMNGSILATLACLATVGAWNEFLLPLLVLRDPARLPMAVQLYRLEGAYVKEWGVTMAAYSIAAVPLIILFIFTMRYFVRGIGAGAVKG
jgi:ABC-type glycerol-3-phosphate transport system permease component